MKKKWGNKAGMVVCTCYPSNVGSMGRRMEVEGWLWGKKHETLSKKIKQKRAGSVVQVIECLPSKYDTLSSNPSITKTKQTIITY
jgi:hypothetical protein